MAGAYPDYPSRRFAWDADGTVGLWRSTGTPNTEMNAATRAELNDEDNTEAINLGTGDKRVCVIFPELRELDGIFIWEAQATTTEVDTSADTTNSIDGTWTNRIASYSDPGSTVFNTYRTSVTSMAVSNVRGIRILHPGGGTHRLHAIHLFGELSAGETPDRLLFIDEVTGLEFTNAKDYGNVPRGGSEDFEWRIKNNSASLTANTIQYTAEALYLGANAWFTNSLPGGSTFQATQQITSLAAATTTGIITTRRVTLGTTTPQQYAARLYLSHASFS